MDVTDLIPAFGNTLMTTLAFVVALSIIVAVHEYGHYIVGRWTGIRAEVFSLGFGPVLISRRDRHGTLWQIAALPLGGYVKFLGDANAASGQSAAALAGVPEAERRHTMAGAPLWARALTVAAGPVFNFVLAALIFFTIAMISGRAAEPLTVGHLRPLPVADYGLRPGDKVLGIGGLSLGEVARAEEIGEAGDSQLLDYRVQRGADEITVTGPYPMPPLVAALAPQSAAYDVDMKPGDVIVSVDETPIRSFLQFKDRVEASDGRPLRLVVWRAGSLHDFVLAPRRVDEPDGQGGFRTEWRVGIVGGMAFTPATETPGVLEALGSSVLRVWDIITGSVHGLYSMITGAISSCNISGPIGIAKASGVMASQGTQSFLSFVAVLSVAVGFLNLLPVPVLDGGHLVFYAYEGLSGKPPPERALGVLMTVGLALLLSLMVFALSNDLFCP